MKTYDVAILGAGVTGCAVARELGRYNLSTLLIDAEADIAMGATHANSGIVHAGYDCAPGTLMARLNVRGNALFGEWCRDLSVPFQRVGSLVVAFSPDDEATLASLLERGKANGVPDLEILSGDAARTLEPLLSPAVSAALHAPTGGITSPYKFSIACAENARENGCEWLFGERVTHLQAAPDGIDINTTSHALRARFVVNATGIHADEVARLLGDSSFSIHPRKGEYILFDPTAPHLSKVVFQTPSRLGKGVLVSPTIDGNSFVGPTAIDQDDRTDTSVSAASLATLRTHGVRSVPSLDFSKIITQFAGLRAQPSGAHDFILRLSAAHPRFILAAGICSPGLTSAPAIAEEVVRLLASAGLSLSPRPTWQPLRFLPKPFHEMTDSERAAAIAQNPLYGRIICRCETVSEAEIVDAIHRGATTLDGIKRRVRTGMGRCQGGFCTPRILSILSRELGLPLTAITKSGAGSPLAFPRFETEERPQP